MTRKQALKFIQECSPDMNGTLQLARIGEWLLRVEVLDAEPGRLRIEFTVIPEPVQVQPDRPGRP